MTKVNLKSLSRELDLSISTVSKALRGSYEISEDTKKKVIDLAQLKGYSPNPFAASLRNNRSHTIAVIVPELTNNFFIQAISGVESVSQEKDYHVQIYVTHDDMNLEKSILKNLQNGRVDGVIMSVACTTTDYAHFNEIIRSGVPIVFFDRICHEIETAKITTDDFVSGFNATEHLIQQGCKDIAYLSVSESLSIDRRRLQGYLEAINKYDVKSNPGRVIQCNTDESYNYQSISSLLQGKNKPDGIFASVEKLALTTYYVCRDLKIKIPQTLKVVSFSNLRTAPLLNPSLTTITQPSWEMGMKAASILFQHLDKKRAFFNNENIIIKSELIIRDSTSTKIY